MDNQGTKMSSRLMSIEEREGRKIHIETSFIIPPLKFATLGTGTMSPV